MAPTPIPMSTVKYTSLASPESDDQWHDLKRASDVDGGSSDSTDDDASDWLDDELSTEHVSRGRQQRRARLCKLLWTLLVILGATVVFVGALWTALDATGIARSKPVHTDAAQPSHPTDKTLNDTDGQSVEEPIYNSTVADDEPQTFKIHFHGEDSINRREPLDKPACPIRVEYTQDEEHADAVVWNSDAYDGLTIDERRRLNETRPAQKHVIWGAESAPNRGSLERFYHSIDETGHSDLYDADMTYRLNGSVPGTYSYSFFNYSNLPVPYENKRQDRIAAAFVSNCHPRNARSLILQYLIELLPGQIDSFGSCHGNANAEETLKELGLWQQVGPGPTRWNIKISTMKRYKFAIAFENSNDLDYVTEKFFQPLEQGVVPLTFGPPDVARRFFPAPNAAIDVGRFLSPRLRQLSTTESEEPESLSESDKQSLSSLADRLKFLSSVQGKEEYLDMLSWKANDDWKTASPLGKVVDLNKGYDRDCKLAGFLRGLDWARSNWTDPNPPGPMDEIWQAVREQELQEAEQAENERQKENESEPEQQAASAST
ncbi:hypothetical protein OIV83_001508 [Microbotryomycetes sp. JL201]|nr:hypothetical protein OIV83_001508 [Microbotryomycetes sp. JL201]